MKRLIGVVLICAALGACNTVEGVGEDISAGARTIKNAF